MRRKRNKMTYTLGIMVSLLLFFVRKYIYFYSHLLHSFVFLQHNNKKNIYIYEYNVVDKLSATKLYFAFLQYPAIEFYGLSESCHNNRILLLAFAWLLATQNVLSIVVRVNLTSSLLGRECSCPDISLVNMQTLKNT